MLYLCVESIEQRRAFFKETEVEKLFEKLMSCNNQDFLCPVLFQITNFQVCTLQLYHFTTVEKGVLFLYCRVQFSVRILHSDFDISVLCHIVYDKISSLCSIVLSDFAHAQRYSLFIQIQRIYVLHVQMQLRNVVITS